jgi:hypothetical protein
MKLVKVVMTLDEKSKTYYVANVIQGPGFPMVVCAHCGKGIALPAVLQQCSNCCGAYVAEVIFEGYQEETTKQIKSNEINRLQSSKSEF